MVYLDIRPSPTATPTPSQWRQRPDSRASTRAYRDRHQNSSRKASVVTSQEPSETMGSVA